MYAGSAPCLPGTMAYPQPNNLPAGVGGPGPVAASMPTYVPTSAPYYSSSLYPSPGAAPNALYASASLAYAAQPHLAGHSSATPAAPIPTNPYMGATVPSRFTASAAYTGAHIITTSAGATPFASNPVYRPAGPSVGNPSPYHPAVYPPTASGITPHPMQLSSYHGPGMVPNGAPLMGASPAYTPAAPPYNQRM